MNCPFCGGKGYIKQGDTTVACSCVDGRKIIKGIRAAIRDFERSGKHEAAENLAAVLMFLPDYPVMASLEAEARGLHEDFILMIRDTFQVRPLA